MDDRTEELLAAIRQERKEILELVESISKTLDEFKKKFIEPERMSGNETEVSDGKKG